MPASTHATATTAIATATPTAATATVHRKKYVIYNISEKLKKNVIEKYANIFVTTA